MHIVVIAWLYVALLMAIAEASNSTGSVLGGVITFLLYGLVPLALVVYLMGAPGRRRAARQREAAERAAARAAHAAEQSGHATSARPASGQPDQRGEAPAEAIAPVRKEP